MSPAGALMFVRWWLGENRDAHLREARDALLVGGGADGTTSPETEGGLFFRPAAAHAEAALAGA